MQFNPQDLKEKLLKALDKDQNVVDMVAVQDVFTQLEMHPITREALEQTRIGRYVNELRRKKTTSKDLAKRAKNLVRKWQALIPSTGNNNGTPQVNGERVVNNRVGPDAGTPGPYLPAHVLQSSKPASPASRPATPHSAGVKSNNSSPALVRTPASTNSRISPKMPGSLRATPSAPNSPALMTSTPLNTCVKTKKQLPPETPRSHHPQHIVPKDNSALSKTHTASKKRRRNQDSTPSPILPNKRPANGENPNGTTKSKPSLVNGFGPQDTATNGSSLDHSASSFAVRKNSKLSIRPASSGNLCTDVSSPLERIASSSVCSDHSGKRTPLLSRTPKVKTTAELIQDLATRKELNLEGSETVAKITQNRIEKEHEEEVSIVPAGAKPRPRRTPGATLPNTSDQALSKTKNEMVRKFLESSVSASQTDLSSMMHFNGLTNEESLSASRVVSPGSSSTNNVDSVHASSNSLHEETIKREASPAKDLIVKARVRDVKPIMTKPEQTEDAPRDPAVLYLIEQNPRLAGWPDEDLLKRLAEDPLSLLPEAMLKGANNVIEETEPLDSPLPATITDSDVEKLHNEQLEGVNGLRDYKNEWQNWRQTYSMPTYNKDLLHILPYVDIDVVTDEQVGSDGLHV